MSQNYLVALRDSGTPPAAVTGKVKSDFALTYYVNDVDTATTAITIAEIGTSGDYIVTVPDPATSEDHTLILEDAGTLGVPNGFLQRIDWSANTQLVADLISGGGTVSYDGPVAPTGDVEIVRGDDYLNADGRALAWTDTSWPSLIGASILLNARNNQGNSVIEDAAGVVVDADSIYVELTSTQTTTTVGDHDFDVQATLASGSIVTLQLGDFRINQEMTRA